MKMDAQMSIRTTTDVKKKAMEVYNELGVDLTTAINVFLRKSIEQKGFPFPVRQEPSSIDLEERMNNTKNKKNLSKKFSSVD